MKSPFYEVYLQISQNETQDITDYIDTFDYEDCLHEDDMLTLKITDKSLAFLENKYLEVGKMVLFKFGYLKGAFSELHKARITDVESNYGELISTTLKCYDMGTVMKKSTHSKVWKMKRSSEIAAEIAKKYALATQIEETKKIHPTLAQGGKTDFQFLSYLATLEENGSYRFFIKDDVLHFTKTNFKQSSRRIFVYRDNSEEANLISFKPAWRESTQDSSADTLKMTGFDPLLQQSKEKTFHNGNTKEDVRLGNAVPSYNANGEKIDQSAKLITGNASSIQSQSSNTFSTPDFSLDSISNKAQHHKKKQSQKILVATLVIEGDPNLRADELISIAGVAKIHSGNWYIEKIKHSITQSGYLSTLELSKNAINAKGANLRHSKISSNSHLAILPSYTEQNNKQAQGNNAQKKEIPSYDANGKKL